MDFTLTERETYFRDRVKAFIDARDPPARRPIIDRQAHEGERWKVIPVIEEVKAKAKAAGLWNFFMPPHSGQHPCRRQFRVRGHAAQQPRICAVRRGDGQIGWASRVLQLLRARHRQHGGVPPLWHARAEGAVARSR